MAIIAVIDLHHSVFQNGPQNSEGIVEVPGPLVGRQGAGQEWAAERKEALRSAVMVILPLGELYLPFTEGRGRDSGHHHCVAAYPPSQLGPQGEQRHRDMKEIHWPGESQLVLVLIKFSLNLSLLLKFSICKMGS